MGMSNRSKPLPVDPAPTDLAARLRCLADLVGGRNALASIADVSRSAISLWFGGKRPNDSTLERIASRTNVPFLWLSEGRGIAPTADTVQRSPAIAEPIPTLTPGRRAIPSFDPSWLRAKWPGLETGRVALWITTDDSMSPTIGVNEPVLLYMLDPEDEEAGNPLAWLHGDSTIVLVAYEGREKLLRRVVVEQNHLLYKADSPEKRDLIGYPNEILGIAFWAGRTLRG